MGWEGESEGGVEEADSMFFEAKSRRTPVMERGPRTGRRRRRLWRGRRGTGEEEEETVDEVEVGVEDASLMASSALASTAATAKSASRTSNSATADASSDVLDPRRAIRTSKMISECVDEEGECSRE